MLSSISISITVYAVVSLRDPDYSAPVSASNSSVAAVSHVLSLRDPCVHRLRSASVAVFSISVYAVVSLRDLDYNAPISASNSSVAAVSQVMSLRDPCVRRLQSNNIAAFSIIVSDVHTPDIRLGLDYADPKRKGNFLGKVFLAAGLTALCIIMIKQSPSLSSTSPFAIREPGVTHVLVTGGAGYIGSHATLRLLKENYRVTIVDNLSRGNMGAVRVLQNLFPEPGRLQFIYVDLGDQTSVNKIFLENKFDAVMHFAAIAYVGESTEDPLK
ncbi:hypothetical protein HN873_064037 [Arachis hypogaea]|uniref:NAD(P)-binding domain-containing protein n=2 Tax=Arachis TaxID=3817 RepID=A0A444Y1T3_ARAHY|nr:hypothetical protein Ahy_B08g091276 [Arachis hypogaea]